MNHKTIFSTFTSLFCLLFCAILLLTACQDGSENSSNDEGPKPSPPHESSGNPMDSTNDTVSGIETYTLTYTCQPDGAGVIRGESSFTLAKGELGGYISVEAQAGYIFEKWSDGSTDPFRGGDTVTKDTEIVAIFSPRAYTLQYKPSTPSGGSVYGETTQTLKAGEKGGTVTAVPAAYYSFRGWSDGVTDYTRSGDSITEDTTIRAIFEHDPIHITVPTIHITTETGRPVNSKTEYVGATMSISGAENEADNLTDVSLRIKGRGNSSWSTSAATSLNDHKSKNSYTIKLDEKAQLLGLGRGSDKTWVLNSNKYDESGLRNWISWRMGELLDGVDYSIDMTWVHLHVNGNYRGVYMLTEKVETGSDRVNIETEDSSVLDKGYLLQIDKRAEGTENWDYFYIDGFIGEKDENNPRPFVIENGVESQEQVKYIQNYIQQCYDAVRSGNEVKIRELIDVDSFIDMFLIEEMAKDVDMNFASFYLYKAPGGKLHLTSPWDFDFGYGTYSSAMKVEELLTEKKTGSLWFQALIKCEWFSKEVVERMEEVTPYIYLIYDELDAMEASLTPEMDRNDERWNIYGEHYAEYVAAQVSTNLHSYEDHVNYLQSWVLDRWDLMLAYMTEYANGEGPLQQ